MKHQDQEQESVPFMIVSTRNLFFFLIFLGIKSIIKWEKGFLVGN